MERLLDDIWMGRIATVVSDRFARLGNAPRDAARTLSVAVLEVFRWNGRKSQIYPSDLTDAQWAILAPMIPTTHEGRPRVVDMRKIANGMFYRCRSACRRRMPPEEYGPHRTVYHYYRDWVSSGTWGRIRGALREGARVAVGRDPTPGAGGIDSPTVKGTEVGGDRGFDQAREATGTAKKRHTGTDTLGLLLAVAVTGAGVSDPAGATRLCCGLGPDPFPRLALLWADGTYHNYDLYAHMGGRVRWRIEVVSRPPDAVGWVTLPHRWVVERTHAWIGRYRASSEDYERCNKPGEGTVYTAMTRLMLNRPSPGPPGPPFRYRKNVA